MLGRIKYQETKKIIIIFLYLILLGKTWKKIEYNKT